MRPTFVVLLLLCVSSFNSTTSFARVPTRPSSANGQDGAAANWNLVAPSAPITLTANGKTAVFTRQVVCTNQQVTNAVNPNDLANNGACENPPSPFGDGMSHYTFLYQFQSKSTNVKVTFGRLVGFTADALGETYGVELCDNKGNTYQLCTTATEPQLPDITFTSINKKTISFLIPNFPAFPAGTHNQGQGLTLVFITTQPSPLPISYPTVGIQ